MQSEEPSKPVVLVLTTLILVAGGLGTAALFSNIDPAAKTWIAGLVVVVMSLFALAAMGTLAPVRRRVSRFRFNQKLQRNYSRLRMLGPFLTEVEKHDSAYRNLLTLFLTDESNRRNTGQKAAYGIGLLNSARDASTKFRDEVFRYARLLLEEHWFGPLKTTSQLYHAVQGLCAFVDTIGDIVEGLVEDLNRVGGTAGGSGLQTAYEVFRQDYAGLADSLHRFVMENEVVFGRKIDFTPRRLPMLITPATFA